MKTKTARNLALLLALISVNVLISCAQKRSEERLRPSNSSGGRGQISEGGAQTAGPSSPSNSGSGQTAMGTSTSGGGTGVADKVWASYIVDPMTLPAFQNHLKAQLQNIKDEDMKELPEGFDHFFKTKTWYIAPIDLQTMDKEAIGVAFMKGSMQQMAVQTLDAVWIDKRVWDRMKLEDQSDLLRHELVMSLYLIRFLTLTDMCKRSMLVIESKNDCKIETDMQRWANLKLKAEPPRKLTEEDNENIRFVEGWLAKYAKQPFKEVDFIKVLAGKNFDKRMFNPDNYVKNPQDRNAQPIKMSAQDLQTALRGAVLSGNLPETCTGLETKLSAPCKIELNLEKVKTKAYGPEIAMTGFTLTLKIPGQPDIQVADVTGDEIELSASEEEEGQIVYTLPIVSWKDKVKIGTRANSGFLFFSKTRGLDKDQLNLDTIILKPGVVIGIDKKSEDVSCPMRSLRAENLSNDTLIIRRKGAKPAPMIEDLYSKTPPTVVCSKSNVE